MTEFRFAIVRRLMEKRLRAIYDSRRIPIPDDHEIVRTPGDDPDRILLAGNGLLAGMGVDSQDRAVAGHLSRELALHTGRPCEVSLLVDVRLRCADMPALVDAYDFSGFDAVVVLTGASDAVQLLPAAEWRRQESDLLRALDVRIPASVDVLVVGINPPSTVPTLSLNPGCRADERAEQFNHLTERLCRRRFRYVPPPAIDRLGPLPPHGHHHPGDGEEQVSAGYRSWAAEIAAHLEYVRSQNPAWHH
jgi:hypothetical protein